jgi:diguanylate cyclase (GGDEF)-like protein
MLRKQDVVGRWGGEEFILLLPETPMQGGQKISEEIRKKIAKTAFSYNSHQLSTTLTFGISEFNGLKDIIPCIKEADQALYDGKQSGKNCVVLSTIIREN